MSQRPVTFDVYVDVKIDLFGNLYLTVSESGRSQTVVVRPELLKQVQEAIEQAIWHAPSTIIIPQSEAKNGE